MFFPCLTRSYHVAFSTDLRFTKIVATGNRRDSKNYRTEHVERMESGALSVAGIPGALRQATRPS